MRFKSIRLKEGLFERVVEFTEYVNLIHSKKNSCGKTTLLRFLLYGLGYSVPNTRNIKFDKCEVEVALYSEKCGGITLFRNNDLFIQTTIGEDKQTYVLPEQLMELHQKIFGTSNANVLNNLLGTFYVDQEKGWTILNRGVVIGSIHFNIEELIRGLSDRDCEKLIKKEAQLSNELSKYKQMFSVAQYRKKLEQETGELITDSYEEETEVMLNQLLLQKKRLKKELGRIDDTISNNKKFKEFIINMKLYVQSPDGVSFPVKEENIVGFNDAVELLIAKRKIVSAEINDISRKIDEIEKEKNKEYEQLAFIKEASQLEIFDKQVIKMPIDPIAVNKEITRIQKELSAIRSDISNITKRDNIVVSQIYKDVIKYYTELGLGEKDSIPESYLFTSNLKELSGAVMHKMVFAFRLAYILAVERTLKIKMPIILDSPSGKEVDQENIKMMMGILDRDFSDHQIIIASIFTYDFKEINIIEIEDRLISQL